MKLIFEKSKKGRGCSILPPCDVSYHGLPEKFLRKVKARLPSLDENEISRHYSAMAKRAFGVNDGFYPLGSCTMKYNPKINEEIAGLPGFRDIHPLQGSHTVQGCLKILELASDYLKEISGMDAMSFQPAAGWKLKASMPVISFRYSEATSSTLRHPWTVCAGCRG